MERAVSGRVGLFGQALRVFTCASTMTEVYEAK